MVSDSKIKVGIYGSPHHTNLLVNQINSFNDRFYAINVINNRFSHDCDIYHSIYGYLSKRFIITKFFGKKNICHWIGTDVLDIITNWRFRIARKFLEKFIDLNIAGAEHLIKEIKEIGIESRAIPIVPNYEQFRITPFPEKFTILTYLPQNRLEFYNYNIILSIVKANPDIQFIVLANSGKNMPKFDNVKYVEWVYDISYYYYKSTVILRIPKHDGMSLSILEGLVCGRQIIWNYPFPYCYNSLPEFENIQNILENIKKNPELNVEGSDFVRKYYSVEKIVKYDLFSIYNELLNTA